MPRFGVPKPSRFQCPEYLAYVRNQPCAVSHITMQCFGDTDPDHLKTRGSGGSDLTCVPLCRRHHSERHAIGSRRFEQKYNIDFQEINLHCLIEWMEAFILTLEHS